MKLKTTAMKAKTPAEPKGSGKTTKVEVQFEGFLEITEPGKDKERHEVKAGYKLELTAENIAYGLQMISGVITKIATGVAEAAKPEPAPVAKPESAPADKVFAVVSRQKGTDPETWVVEDTCRAYATAVRVGSTMAAREENQINRVFAIVRVPNPTGNGQIITANPLPEDIFKHGEPGAVVDAEFEPKKKK